MEYFAGRAATGFAIPEWLPIPDNVQYNRAVSDLEGIVYNIITQRRSHGPDAAEVCLRKVIFAVVRSLKFVPTFITFDVWCDRATLNMILLVIHPSLLLQRETKARKKLCNSANRETSSGLTQSYH